MPAKGSDDLFRLIKALSPAEKGYFKKFADRYSFSEKDNNYLKLFELIDAQEVYDEKKIQKASFINQLPRQKNYLQSLILKSLQSYDSETELVIGLENSIQQVRALRKRRQYELCRKVLLKAKKEAIRCECFMEALKLVKLEDIVNKESGMDRSYETEKLNYVERYKLMAQEKNSDEIQELEQQVIMFTRNAYSKNAQLKNALLTEDRPLLSHKARQTFYNTLSVYHNFMRNYDKQYVYSKEYIKLKKKYFKEFGGVYAFLPAYTNIAYACIANNRYKECNDAAEELLRVPVNNKQEEDFRHHIYVFIKTSLFVTSGKFEPAIAFLKNSFEDFGPDRFMANPIKGAEITRNAVLIYFAGRKYKDCLRHLGTLLSSQIKDVAAFSHYQSLIINILVHYELGNKETTEHLVISARRTLKNTGQLTSLEDIFLSFLRKHLSDESDKKLIIATIEKLKKIKDEENYHTHVSIYSFCLSWLESKAANKSIAEIIKTKAKKEAGENHWD